MKKEKEKLIGIFFVFVFWVLSLYTSTHIKEIRESVEDEDIVCTG